MRRVLALLLCALMPLAAGCAFSQGSTGQTGLSNQPDSFEYGFQGVKSGTESHRWENTHDSARVHTGTQSAGSLKILIKDATGATVYDKTQQTSQAAWEGKTLPGKPGTWTITLTFTDYAGQGGIRITGMDG